MAIDIDVHSFGWYEKCWYIGRLVLGYNLKKIVVGITFSTLNHMLLFHFGPFKFGYDFTKYGVEEWRSK